MKKSTILLFFSLLNIFSYGQFGLPAEQTWSQFIYPGYLLEHPEHQVNWIIYGQNQDLWLGTNGGLCNYKDEVLTTYNIQNSNIPTNAVGKLAFDISGNLWFINLGGSKGVVKFDGVNFTAYNSNNSGLPSYTFGDIAIDDAGVVWLAGASGSNGIVSFDGSSVTEYNTSNTPINSNLIRTVNVESGNLIWFSGIDGGLVKFDGVNWSVYDTSNSIVPSNEIRNLVIKGNEKWFWNETQSNGNFISSFDEISNTLTQTPSSLNFVNNIDLDSAGNLWFSGDTINYANVPVLMKFDGINKSYYSPGTEINGIEVGKSGLGNGAWVVTNSVIYKNAIYAAIPQNNSRLILNDFENPKIGNKEAYLDINNVRVHLMNNGSICKSGEDSINGNFQPAVEFPKADSTFSVKGAGFWLIGKDESNTLRSAVNHLSSGATDFTPGPIDSIYLNDSIYDIAFDEFNNMWKINKTTIDSFRLNLFPTMPEIIKEWPARGNEIYTYMPDREFAPFMDVDQDGYYNPSIGDYPLIKGDQAVWWIANDIKGSRGVQSSSRSAIGVEAHYMAYSYSTNDVLNNTTFYEVKITNLSDKVLTDANLTIAIETDLGNFADDYIASDESRKMGICYNGDSFDEGYSPEPCYCYQASKPYGNNAPIVGINMLQGPKDEFREPLGMKNLLYYNCMACENPHSIDEAWNYMNSLWRDGSHIVYGGNGHENATFTTPTNFVFPDNPSDTSGWSECTANTFPGDRTMIITYGEFNLVPNRTNSFTFSIIHSPSIGGGCDVDFNPIQNAADSVQAFFDSTLCEGFDLELTSLNQTTCGNNYGYAAAFASGGTPPYFFDWTSGSITAEADSLPAGQYVVTAIDVMGCSKFLTVNIYDTDGPQLNYIVNDVECYGGSNGSIDLESSPAVGLTYLWSNGSVTQDISGLVSGPYDVIVTDTASGCVAVETIVVEQSGELVITYEGISSTCGGNDGEIDITVNGGITPYSYQWSSSVSTEDIQNLGASIYNVSVLDALGCRVEKSIALNDSLSPILEIDSIIEVNCYFAGSGAIYVNTSGGQSPYMYQWSTSETTEDITGLEEELYILTVTDNAGCISGLVVELESNKPEETAICLVSVDSISKGNEIGWTKAATSTIDHYNVYREGSIAGNYFQIGQVPYDSLSLFSDTLSDPNIKSWRYKISSVDSCGNESELSSAQKTIHLSIHSTASGMFLAWDHYEGFPFNQYVIHRQINSNSWAALDSVPSNYTYYTDATAPYLDTISYNIEIVSAEICTFTKAQDQNSSRSNRSTSINRNMPDVDTTGNSGVQIIESVSHESSIKVYPNPTSGFFTVEIQTISDETYNIEVFSIDGRLIEKKAKLTSSNQVIKSQFSMSELSSGVYLIRVETEDKIMSARLNLIR